MKKNWKKVHKSQQKQSALIVTNFAEHNYFEHIISVTFSMSGAGWKKKLKHKFQKRGVSVRIMLVESVKLEIWFGKKKLEECHWKLIKFYVLCKLMPFEKIRKVWSGVYLMPFEKIRKVSQSLKSVVTVIRGSLVHKPDKVCNILKCYYTNYASIIGSIDL